MSLARIVLVEDDGEVRRRFTDLLDKAFEGSAAGLVMHALSGQRASKKEIEEIRKLLDEQTRGTR